jgi:NADH:ubiquinone oxidoreductase subunit 5 (subunit L)/multisubunit Na+/H+ antiporter MnhA subunit
MPWTAVTFLVGAVAICGLPPFNGFVSEFLIYMGGFRAVAGPRIAAAGVMLIVGLALIGGLAAACFTKAFGIVFLGEPRSEHPTHAHEAGWLMRIPMLILAVGCLSIGVFAPWVIGMTGRAVAMVSGLSVADVQTQISFASSPLTRVVLIAGLFAMIALLLAWVRHKMLPCRASLENTWDCGYARPTSRMQYSASSFAQPLTTMFEPFLRPKVRWEKPEGLFPKGASFHSHTEDLFQQSLYRPIFLGFEKIALGLRFLQAGRVQLYILYIALTLFILLIWNLR